MRARRTRIFYGGSRQWLHILGRSLQIDKYTKSMLARNTYLYIINSLLLLIDFLFMTQVASFLLLAHPNYHA